MQHNISLRNNIVEDFWSTIIGILLPRNKQKWCKNTTILKIPDQFKICSEGENRNPGNTVLAYNKCFGVKRNSSLNGDQPLLVVNLPNYFFKQKLSEHNVGIIQFVRHLKRFGWQGWMPQTKPQKVDLGQSCSFLNLTSTAIKSYTFKDWFWGRGSVLPKWQRITYTPHQTKRWFKTKFDDQVSHIFQTLNRYQ